jgi:carnitine O-acetyltransferase
MMYVAKTSPDSYMQMALQLAWFRLHKKVTPVYESSSTRGFFEARTETGRSLSSESKAFVESFDNDNVLVCRFC